MKKAIFAVLTIAVATLAGAGSVPPPTPVLKTDRDKASYWVGVLIAKSVQKQKDLVPEFIVRGVKDVLSGAKLLMTDPEMAGTIQAYSAELQARAAQAAKAAKAAKGAKAAKAGKAVKPAAAAKPKAGTRAAVAAKPLPITADAVPKTRMDKVSYSGGIMLGRRMKMQGADVDPVFLASGFMDQVHGKKLLLADKEGAAVMAALSATLQKQQLAKMQEMAKTKMADDAKAAEARKADAAKNQKAGDDFLAKNKMDKAVVVLPSGLQYKVIHAGTGKKPVDTDTVRCYYRGTLIDGTEFDRSRGTPVEFPVRGVIPGWTEALKLMPVGSKWQLYVPASLAYGDRGAGGVIGPNQTLIFEIELVEIKGK